MRINIRATLAMLLIVAAVSLVPAAAQPSALPTKPSAELALTYTYLHANAPPNSCGCFSMNGGGASFAYPVSHSFSVVAEAGATAASNIDSTGLDVTLSTYLAGSRYSLRSTRFTPYVQFLFGAAHASGSLAPGQFGLGSSTVFAMAAGGGLDLNLTHRFAFRLLQVDYLLTSLPNRANNVQNNLRFSSGVALRFGKK